jgi:hypothetical protein
MSIEGPCASAVADLYVRVWLELEKLLAGRQAAPDSGRQPDAGLAVITLRLELVLLIEGCDRPGWRSTLGPRACAELRALLSAVLGSLGGAAEDLDPLAIAGAQNRLLDEILRVYEATSDDDGRRARKLA